MAEAVGRLAGAGGLKGGSPVTPRQQTELEIQEWLRRSLTDSPGALQIVLLRAIKASDFLLDDNAQPLAVLTAFCRRVLASDRLLQELVRETDMEWGRMFDERPHFEKEGSQAHPEDPYTIESVSGDLSGLIKLLTAKG